MKIYIIDKEYGYKAILTCEESKYYETRIGPTFKSIKYDLAKNIKYSDLFNHGLVGYFNTYIFWKHIRKRYVLT